VSHGRRLSQPLEHVGHFSRRDAVVIDFRDNEFQKFLFSGGAAAVTPFGIRCPKCGVAERSESAEQSVAQQSPPTHQATRPATRTPVPQSSRMSPAREFS